MDDKWNGVIIGVMMIGALTLEWIYGFMVDG